MKGLFLFVGVDIYLANREKQNANLKPINKGEITREEAKKRGRAGGIKSGEVRKEKKDAKAAARYILNLAAKGRLKENLIELGATKEEQTNLIALQARLFTLAMSGNLDAYRELMKIAGFEPEENRKERESLASDRRRDIEIDAKVNALGGGVENAKISLNMTDENENTDVVIYLPEIEDEKNCELPPENEYDGEQT